MTGIHLEDLRMSGAPLSVVQEPTPPAVLERLHVDAAFIEACGLAAAALDGANMSLLGVTSALRGEGRTSVALAMAAVLTREYGRSAILVDGDLEGPSLARLLERDTEPGLADVLRGRASIEEAVQNAGEGLQVLTAGHVGMAPEVAAGLAASNLLQTLQANHDVVIVDLPSIIDSRCGARLAARFPQPLFVIRAGVAPANKVREALDKLTGEPSVLLNGAHTSIPRWLRRLVD